jgi:hypothetical protein
MNSLGDAIPETLPTQLQALRLGLYPSEWYLVASSHEVSTDFGNMIRTIWPYLRVTTIGYSNSQLSYMPSDNVLGNPVPCLNFPFCNGVGRTTNYEGGHAFAWYAHRAPLETEVDEEFYDGNVALLNPGWQPIGHATEVSAMTSWNGRLFATTANDRLWWREPVLEDIPWTDMGHATIVVGLAAVNGKLFCATSDGKLWWREPYGFDLPWEHIGHAVDITAMTALDGKLFATTSENQLWQRDAVGEDIPWELLGHAIGVVGMAAARGKLIAATSDDNLHWREPMAVDFPWHRFGEAGDVVGMAALDNVLYVATQEGGLWQRNL